MRKRTIACLMAGVLFSLMLGIGCGKTAVENVAVKKTEAAAETGAPSEGAGNAVEEEEQNAGEGTGREAEESSAEGERGGTEKSGEEKRRVEISTEGETEETEKQKALRERLGAPERLSAESVDEDGIVQTLNAAVMVPDADFFTVCSAEARAFGNGDVKTLVEPLLGEGGLYCFEPEEYEHIVNQMAFTELRLKYGYYIGDEDEQGLKGSKEMLEGCIEDMQDEVRKTEIPLLPEPYDNLNMGDRLEGFTDWEQRTVQVGLRKYGLSVMEWPNVCDDPCTIYREEAEKLAEAYMEKLGLSEEWSLYYAGLREFDIWTFSKAGYVFEYVREIRGVPVAEAAKLSFLIDDRGVADLRYTDLNVREGEEEAALLPFSKIQKVYQETRIPVMCEPNELQSVTVDELRLAYHYVPDTEESRKTGSLVPAWNAYGTYQFLDEEGVLRTSLREPLLSVNAMDGTILD